MHSIIVFNTKIRAFVTLNYSKSYKKLNKEYIKLELTISDMRNHIFIMGVINRKRVIWALVLINDKLRVKF